MTEWNPQRLRPGAPLVSALLGFAVACTTEIGDPPGFGRAPTSPVDTSTVTPSVSGTPGAVSGPPTASGGGPATSTTPTPVPMMGTPLPYTAPVAADAALPARTWLLTPEQYGRAVQALLGVTPDVSTIDPAPDTGIYPNMSASGVVRVTQASQYASSAEAVTTALSETALAKLVPCGKLETSCKTEFLPAVIRKAFRRPASAEDLTRYGEIFDLAATTGDAALPFRSVLRALLTSPFFLYRTEIGGAADAASARFSLTGPEVASLLSFSIVGSPPEESLLLAAERGELTNATTLRSHVTSLLSRPEAAEYLARFLVEWLRLHHFEDVEKFESVFPGFSDVKTAMFEEARDFLRENGGVQGTVSGLLTAPVKSSSSLEAFYQSDASSTGSASRIGLLSLGAVLSKSAKQYLTSPTLRGLFIRDQLLCQHIMLPDNFTPPPIEAAEAALAPKTTRQLYDQHANNPACSSCHALIDPLGYALEGFDGAGRSRTSEAYQSPSFNAPSAPEPIDTRGTLAGTDVDRPFASYVELAQALAESSWVKECVARQAFRYYFGQLETDRGIPAVTRGTEALLASGTLGDLIASLMSTNSTLERAR